MLLKCICYFSSSGIIFSIFHIIWIRYQLSSKYFSRDKLKMRRKIMINKLKIRTIMKTLNNIRTKRTDVAKTSKQVSYNEIWPKNRVTKITKFQYLLLLYRVNQNKSTPKKLHKCKQTLSSIRTGLYSNGSTHQSVLGIETYLTIVIL